MAKTYRPTPMIVHLTANVPQFVLESRAQLKEQSSPEAISAVSQIDGHIAELAARSFVLKLQEIRSARDIRRTPELPYAEHMREYHLLCNEAMFEREIGILEYGLERRVSEILRDVKWPPGTPFPG